MQKYDLHIHTKHSICSILEPQTILKIVKKLGYDGIAITDHNTLKGALKVKKLNKDRDFEVIIGEEVKTDQGEVILYYVQDEIKKSFLFDVIDKAREQDCIISVAHPFRPLWWHRFRYPFDKLKKKIDAVECWNSRTFSADNKKAEKICEELGFAKTAGSDSHFGFELGTAKTLFDGDLRSAIKKRKTRIEGNNKHIFRANLCTVPVELGRKMGLIKKY